MNVDESLEVNALVEQVITSGMLRVRSDVAELQAKGLMDARGNLLIDELPPDMREGSERDFGG